MFPSNILGLLWSQVKVLLGCVEKYSSFFFRITCVSGLPVTCSFSSSADGSFLLPLEAGCRTPANPLSLPRGVRASQMWARAWSLGFNPSLARGWREQTTSPWATAVHVFSALRISGEWDSLFILQECWVGLHMCNSGWISFHNNEPMMGVKGKGRIKSDFIQVAKLILVLLLVSHIFF